MKVVKLKNRIGQEISRAKEIVGINKKIRHGKVICLSLLTFIPIFFLVLMIIGNFNAKACPPPGCIPVFYISGNTNCYCIENALCSDATWRQTFLGCGGDCGSCQSSGSLVPYLALDSYICQSQETCNSNPGSSQAECIKYNHRVDYFNYKSCVCE